MSESGKREPEPRPPIPAAGERQEIAPPSHQADLDMRAAIEAAELTAEEIRRDAEERAAAHLRAAHEKADRLTAERVKAIAAVTDELIGQATAIRSHSDELASALRRATETLTGALSAPAEPSRSPTAISATGVHEDAPLGSGISGAETLETAEDGPEFRARQLAAAGATRRTIAIVLRREFGVEPLPILERAGL